MAIDEKGKVTTTGTMDVKPTTPKAPDLSALGQSAKPAPAPKQPEQPEASPIEQALADRLKNLTAEDNAALDSALSPSVKEAIGKILPEVKPLMDQFGSNEPNVIIPLSTVKSFALKRYGGENEEVAVQNFMTDILSQSMPQQPMEQQTTVPPSPQPQGIMTSPQNMEQV